MSTSRALGIIVVNYGSSQLLEKNLTATARAVPTASIVVVDNFSSAQERDRVEELCAAQGW